MTAYLGELGSLVRVACASDLAATSSRPARYLSTLGGSTFAQVGPRINRVWDVRLPGTSTPADLATWQAFVEGEYGHGPWWFVSDIAAVSNVVSPRGSMLDAGGAPQSGTSVNGGPMMLSDERRSGRSLITESSSVVVTLPRVDGALEYTPVVPGVPVSGSVWAEGPSPRLRLRFYDLAQGVLSTHTVTGSAGGGVQVLAVDGIPAPVDAVSALLLVDGVNRVSRPLISWTLVAPDWSVGGGAPRVHVAAISMDTTLAVEGRTMVGASFQVQEVG